MTNLELLDSVAEECKEILKDFYLVNAKGEQTHINVYTQNLPAKTQKEDTMHFPYLLVCFSDMEIEDSTEVNLYFLIGIIDRNTDNQGYRDVLEIANKLYIHFYSHPVVNKKFRMKRKCKIMLQNEDTFPYFIGGMETTWTLPETVTQIPDKFC